MELRIIIADGLDKAGQEILSTSALVHDCSGIAADELLRTISEYDALIVRSRTKVTAALLETAGRLKVVGRAGVGVDNIDLRAAREREVIVVNAPRAATVTVAELTLGLMLSLARQIPYADAAVKNGGWPKGELLGVELCGKTLGILGMGYIGTALAQRAGALGMWVLGYDIYLSEEKIRSRHALPVSLPDLYSRSDFISVHVPLNEQSRGMVDQDALRRMKRGVRVICTARGGIIDEKALLGALDSGQVAGAALDVYAQEPPEFIELITHPRVVTTPHIGAQTDEAQVRAAEDISNEVVAALKGEPLRWRVV